MSEPSPEEGTKEPLQQEEVVVEISGEVAPASAAEQKASGMGWVPQDQWTGAPDEWRDAKSFVDRGELLTEIHRLKKQGRDQLKAMTDLKGMLSGAEKKGREAAIVELKQQKVTALEQGNYKQVADIDEQLAEVVDQWRHAVGQEVAHDRLADPDEALVGLVRRCPA